MFENCVKLLQGMKKNLADTKAQISCQHFYEKELQTVISLYNSLIPFHLNTLDNCKWQDW